MTYPKTLMSATSLSPHRYHFVGEHSGEGYYLHSHNRGIYKVLRDDDNGKLFKAFGASSGRREFAEFTKEATTAGHLPYTLDTFEDVWMCRRDQPEASCRVVFKNKLGVSLVVGSSHTFISWEDLLRNWTKEDGTPLGTPEKFPG